VPGTEHVALSPSVDERRPRPVGTSPTSSILARLHRRDAVGRGRGSALGASLLDLAALSEREVEAWRDLAGRSVEANPFFEPGFARPAARLLGAGNVQLLVVEADGEWFACLPMQRQGRDPLSAYATWKHIYCFLGTPLLDRARAAEAAGVLTRWCAEQVRPLCLRTAADQRVTARLVEAGAHHGLEVLHASAVRRAALVRDADGNYLDGQRSHRRREQARLRRRLSETLGAELVTVDRAGEDSAVERFLELEAAGWKGRAGTAFACNPAHAELFRELCKSHAAEGRLQLLSLEAGDRAVAMKCNLSSGDELFCFKIAHDESLASYSPGVMLELDNMTIFHSERSERTMDSCADHDNQMINRLWRDRRRIVNLILGPSSLRSKLVGRILRTYVNR
jgi:CelD/BcsL family acetyltransferase involved in cellulose biosynthesis